MYAKQQPENMGPSRPKLNFINCKLKHGEGLPPLISDIPSVISIKMLGATMTNQLSAGEHVRDVIVKSPQSLHARKLHYHGMRDDSLRHVYKAVVLSKLLYASPT